MVLNVLNNLSAFRGDIEIDLLTNKEKIFKERFIDIKTGQHIMRFDTGDGKKLKPLDISKIKNIKDYSLVVVSDYEKGFVTPKIAKNIKAANKENVPVFVDTKKKNIDCYIGAIVKINEKEYNSLETGFFEEDIVVTLGPLGARWKGNVYETSPVQVSDVSGAGDTFLSTLAISYINNNRNMETAIRKAVKAATYVVQKSGTYSLTDKDIEKLRI